MLAATACSPAQSPTPIFSPSPTAARVPPITSAPTTYRPSAAPTRRPTRTPWPTVDASVPVTVAMSLEAARTEVLSWLDPGHQPRILSVDYVPGAAIRAHHTFLDGTQVLFDATTGSLEAHWLPDGIPPALVRVVADTAPLVAPLLDGGFAGTWPGTATPIALRVRIVALFDAVTGERLSARSDREDVVVEPGSSLAAPTAAIVMRARFAPPTGTPTGLPRAGLGTATPVSTPDAPAIDAVSMPDSLRSVLDTYPLLPGSTWTWETISLDNGVRWERSRMRETVTGAWLLAPDRAVVRSLMERWPEFPRKAEAEEAMSKEILWRLVTSDGLVSSFPAAWPFATQAPAPVHAVRVGTPLRPTTGPWDVDIADQVAAAGGPLGLPLEPLVLGTFWSWPRRILQQSIHIATPAGSFDGCRVFDVMLSNGASALRAICPGVGYIETDIWWVQSEKGSGRSVTRLVSYDVVRPR